MKPRFSNRRNQALTLVEVIVIVSILFLLAAILLPALAAAKKKHSRIGCVNNLKQLGLSFRIWSGDNSDKYPMQLSVTNGGAMEQTLIGDALTIFTCMSNEIGSVKVLYCPDDSSRIAATNFSELKGKISYFVNADASNAFPQMILTGDNNLEIGGVPVKPGLLEVFSNTPITWTAARHKFIGNIGLADGSVQQTTENGLRSALVVTNRLAIP